jgi:hypothetical protein
MPAVLDWHHKRTVSGLESPIAMACYTTDPGDAGHFKFSSHYDACAMEFRCGLAEMLRPMFREMVIRITPMAKL